MYFYSYDVNKKYRNRFQLSGYFQWANNSIICEYIILFYITTQKNGIIVVSGQ